MARARKIMIRRIRKVIMMEKSIIMKGRIINYRRGRKTEYPHQYIVEVKNVKSRREAAKLLGRSVRWKSSSGKEIFGSISRVHGNNGALIAKMRRGLPGQAIGTDVDVF